MLIKYILEDIDPSLYDTIEYKMTNHSFDDEDMKTFSKNDAKLIKKMISSGAKSSVVNRIVTNQVKNLGNALSYFDIDMQNSNFHWRGAVDIYSLMITLENSTKSYAEKLKLFIHHENAPACIMMDDKGSLYVVGFDRSSRFKCFEVMKSGVIRKQNQKVGRTAYSGYTDTRYSMSQIGELIERTECLWLISDKREIGEIDYWNRKNSTSTKYDARAEKYQNMLKSAGLTECSECVNYYLKNYMCEENMLKYAENVSNPFAQGLTRFVDLIQYERGVKTSHGDYNNYEFIPFSDIRVKSKVGGRIITENFLPALNFIYKDPSFVGFICCCTPKDDNVYRYFERDRVSKTFTFKEYKYDPVKDVDGFTLTRQVECDAPYDYVKNSRVCGVVVRGNSGRKLIEKACDYLSIAKPELINAILENSFEHYDFFKAVKEWQVVDWKITPCKCICNHENLSVGFVIENKKDQRRSIFPVGAKCITLFDDPRNLIKIGGSDRTTSLTVYNKHKQYKDYEYDYD